MKPIAIEGITYTPQEIYTHIQPMLSAQSDLLRKGFFESAKMSAITTILLSAYAEELEKHEVLPTEKEA